MTVININSKLKEAQLPSNRKVAEQWLRTWGESIVEEARTTGIGRKSFFMAMALFELADQFGKVTTTYDEVSAFKQAITQDIGGQ